MKSNANDQAARRNKRGLELRIIMDIRIALIVMSQVSFRSTLDLYILNCRRLAVKA
ncbi:MAG: hypothetical protein GX781_07135 [Clostridiales bacterium]|nr:hypothetical protein [Clostridiales bacterium]